MNTKPAFVLLNKYRQTTGMWSCFVCGYFGCQHLHVMRHDPTGPFVYRCIECLSIDLCNWSRKYSNIKFKAI